MGPLGQLMKLLLVVIAMVCCCKCASKFRLPAPRKDCTLGSVMARVLLVLAFVTLLLETGVGTSSSAKPRTWWPDINPWNTGKARGLWHTVVTTSDGSVWMFGGETETQQKVKDFLKLDVQTKQWTTITTSGASPLGRYHHAMTAVGSDIYLHGGTNGFSNGETRDRVRRGGWLYV